MDKVYPFLHAHQPQTAILVYLFYVESSTSIVHLQLNVVRAAAQLYTESARPAVLCGIVEGFLGNPEQAQRNIPGQVLRHVPVSNINADFVLYGKLFAKTSNAGRNA